MRRYIILTLTILSIQWATAQVKLSVDTLQCHIVGFSAGVQMPLAGSNSLGLEGGNMKDLYRGPYLDFGLEWGYLFRNGWMLTLDGDLWFGYNSDNLKLRIERMGDVYNSQGSAMSWGGTDGVVTAYNRSLAVRPGVAKMFHILPKDPNSGLFVKLSGGWWMQKTVFSQDMNESEVPQLMDDVGGMPLVGLPELPRLLGWRTIIRATGATQASASMCWSFQE